jgi:hypothetical protein
MTTSFEVVVVVIERLQRPWPLRSRKTMVVKSISGVAYWPDPCGTAGPTHRLRSGTKGPQTRAKTQRAGSSGMFMKWR